MAEIKKVIRLENLVQCRRTLAMVVNELYNGQTDVQTAKAVGYLVGLILNAIREDQLEQRVEALEANQKENKP